VNNLILESEHFGEGEIGEGMGRVFHIFSLWKDSYRLYSTYLSTL